MSLTDEMNAALVAQDPTAIAAALDNLVGLERPSPNEIEATIAGASRLAPNQALLPQAMLALQHVIAVSGKRPAQSLRAAKIIVTHASALTDDNLCSRALFAAVGVVPKDGDLYRQIEAQLGERARKNNTPPATRPSPRP